MSTEVFKNGVSIYCVQLDLARPLGSTFLNSTSFKSICEFVLQPINLRPTRLQCKSSLPRIAKYLLKNHLKKSIGSPSFHASEGWITMSNPCPSYSCPHRTHPTVVEGCAWGRASKLLKCGQDHEWLKLEHVPKEAHHFTTYHFRWTWSKHCLESTLKICKRSIEWGRGEAIPSTSVYQ